MGSVFIFFAVAFPPSAQLNGFNYSTELMAEKSPCERGGIRRINSPAHCEAGRGRLGGGAGNKSLAGGMGGTHIGFRSSHAGLACDEPPRSRRNPKGFPGRSDSCSAWSSCQMKPGLAQKSFRVWAPRTALAEKMDACAHVNPPTVRALFLNGTRCVQRRTHPTS